VDGLEDFVDGSEESYGDHSRLPRIYRTLEDPLDVENVMLFLGYPPTSVFIDIGSMTTYSRL
jgi:hypothetical protein